MKGARYIAAAVLACTLAVLPWSCEKPRDIPSPKTQEDTEPDKPDDKPVTDLPTEPAKATNKVVAHRGGSAECGQPDNSRAALKYAMSLKCYAMECDIYWTKDNDVIVAHAANTYYINNLKPWEHTVEELRRAGKLKNGEELPTLSDMLDIVQVEGNCTKLVLDIKNLDSKLTEYPIKATRRACEIIAERKAEKFCEFICTGNSTVASGVSGLQGQYGIPIGWMANSAPSVHISRGFSWANLSTVYMKPYGSEAARTVDEFLKAKMEISIFNVDQKSGDGNAAYKDEEVNYYISQYDKLRFLCTNYPKWLLSKLN